MTFTCANCEEPIPNEEAVCPACCPPNSRARNSIRVPERKSNVAFEQNAGHVLLGAVTADPSFSNEVGEAEALYEASGTDDPGLKRRIERAKLLNAGVAAFLFLCFAALIISMLSTTR